MVSLPTTGAFTSLKTEAGTFDKEKVLSDKFPYILTLLNTLMLELENTMHDDAVEAGLDWSWRICKLLIQEVSTEVVLLSLSIHNTQ